MSLVLARRGMGIATPEGLLSGDLDSMMHCYLDSNCRDFANLACYTFDYFGDGCSAWRAFNPTPAQIVANNTNAGPALTQASRDEATAQAQAAVAADIAAHPENYGELCTAGQIPMADGTCAPCPSGQTPSNGVCVAAFDWALLGYGLLAVGGLIGVAYLINTVKR